MADVKKYIDLAGYENGQTWLHNYIDTKDALAIKTISFSADGKKVFFYRVDSPASESEAAFEFEVPNPDLDPFVKKVINANTGNVAVLTADGSYKDGGVALTDLAKNTDVATAIAEAIANSSHMKKVIVTTLPKPEDANENTFYLIKIDGVTGKDKYEIWVKIGTELILIDDTSIDLSGYIDTATFNERLATIKQEAITAATEAAAADATSKANQALADSKAYTDGKIAPISSKVTTLETDMTTAKGNITTINNTLTTHSDRITSVEGSLGNIQTATSEEMKGIFDSIFYP